MTKTEAFQISAQEGKQIKHRYFSDDEWITVDSNKITTEEGYRFPIWEFMQYRQSPEWEKDWEILN